MRSIVWLDPSKENVNAGDEIIADAIDSLDLPGVNQARRITTHRFLSREEVGALSRADVVLVGGTNILRSNFLNRQWPVTPRQLFAMRAKTVFLGVGWWQYQSPPGAFTRAALRSISHPVIPHAARDSYTAMRLQSLGLPAVMTSCPTLWNLNGYEISPRQAGSSDSVVVTITDYHFSAVQDSGWLSYLSDRFQSVSVVGMGPGDERAFHSIETPDNVVWRGFGAEVLKRLSGETQLFIGTRLHAGIRWLQMGGAALVLSVDNRAREISRDTGLPVVQRQDVSGINAWLEEEGNVLTVPHRNIESWKTDWSAGWSALQ